MQFRDFHVVKIYWDELNRDFLVAKEETFLSLY